MMPERLATHTNVSSSSYCSGRRRVFADTNQYCEEASLDTQRLINFLTNIGHVHTSKIEQADVIIFYACGHLHRHESDSVRILREINRVRKPTSELLVWGCLPKINPQSLKGVYNGPLIGPEAWDFFSDYFNQPRERIHKVYANTLNVHNRLPGTGASPAHRVINSFREKFYGNPRATWYVKIESGCANCCTYCSDRVAYRWIRSVPIEKILKQFEVGLRSGYRCFNLVGRDLGSYGRDMELTIADLLNAINMKCQDPNYKLYLANISPNMLIETFPRINRTFLAERVFELGSHIQSGSERILKLMGKTFPIDKWQGIIRQIDKNYPGIRTRTSIMVGFPGETESDFSKTLHLVGNVLFDRIDVYKYEERPGIPSLRLKEVVPEEIKQKRYDKMRVLAFMNNVRKRMRRARIAY